jgi:hypothetical protein
MAVGCQIILTGVDFVLDFFLLYNIWLVAGKFHGALLVGGLYLVRDFLVCDFVLDSIWNLDLACCVGGVLHHAHWTETADRKGRKQKNHRNFPF